MAPERRRAAFFGAKVSILDEPASAPGINQASIVRRTLGAFAKGGIGRQEVPGLGVAGAVGG